MISRIKALSDRTIYLEVKPDASLRGGSAVNRTLKRLKLLRIPAVRKLPVRSCMSKRTMLQRIAINLRRELRARRSCH